MTYHCDKPATARSALELAQGAVERVGVKRTKPLIEEERVEPAAASPRQLDQAEGQSKTCKEGLTTGERLHGTGLARESIDDLEVLCEPVAVAGHRHENIGCQRQEGLLLPSDHVTDEAAIGEEAGQLLKRNEEALTVSDAAV